MGSPVIKDTFNNPCPMSQSDLLGAISAIRVINNHIVAQGHRIKASRKILLFVFGEDQNRNLRHQRKSRTIGFSNTKEIMSFSRERST
jgi:hypothetical protein